MVKNKMLIILDLDGTIINSHKQHLNSYLKAIRRSGIYVSKELIDRIKEGFGKPGYTILREVLPNENEIMIQTLLASTKRILHKEEFNGIKLIPGAKDFLKKNSQEHTLVLASSSTKKFAKKILEKFEIKKYFKTIITADIVEHAKPHPESLIKSMQRTGFKKENTVFIGDSIYDYECAKNAEVRFIAVLNNSYFTQELKKAGAETRKNLSEVVL